MAGAQASLTAGFIPLGDLEEMKQRHSYTYLLFHIVVRTKNRVPFIEDENDERTLCEFMRVKARDLDAFIEECGGWKEHLHILIRTRPTVPLATVYGQLKGFASWAWHKRWPERSFGWDDGVWAMSVTPDDSAVLRAYIRSQRVHHSSGTESLLWEPDLSSLAAAREDRGQDGPPK